MRETNGQGETKQPRTGANRMTIRPNGSAYDAEAASTVGTAAGREAGESDVKLLTRQIERLAHDMDKAQIRDYVELMHKPLQLIWRNFLSGLSRGIGIALGFTFFAATIVWILQLLGALNLPIVGDYIADIVRIVQRQLQINPY